MCEFISWIEYDSKNYFLTSKDLETKEGKKLLQKDVKADICGHGAIRAYYPELKNLGINREVIDFSTPLNFPNDIIRAIKTGQFEDIGICIDILNDKGKKEYKKIKQPACAEYEKIKQSAFWKIAKQKKYRIGIWK